MPDDPTPEVNPDADKDAADSKTTDFEKQEVPPGMLPLGPKVFGKWAFFITAVPFIVYLGGTSFGSYLETTRKLQPVHLLRGQCRKIIDEINEELHIIVDEDKAEALKQRIELDKVSHAMDDEAGSVTDLTQECLTLLNDPLEDVSPATKIPRLKRYVHHFLVLEDMVETNQLDDIRKDHAQFVEDEKAILAGEDPSGTAPVPMAPSWYPRSYTIACIAALIAALLALKGYLIIPFRISPLAVAVGVVGVVLWVGLWYIDQNFLGLGKMLVKHARAGFNPFDELATSPSWWMYTFIGVRLLGLVMVVPIVEEFFLRGFLMRYIEDIDWDQIPMGMATWKSIIGMVVYGAATHPGEVVAAIAWFSLVTWLYLKTKNVWDCVIAHATTNGLLAVYVLMTGTWELW